MELEKEQLLNLFDQGSKNFPDIFVELDLPDLKGDQRYRCTRALPKAEILSIYSTRTKLDEKGITNANIIGYPHLISSIKKCTLSKIKIISIDLDCRKLLLFTDENLHNLVGCLLIIDEDDSQE